MDSLLWRDCLVQLQSELPAADFNIWITSLHIEEDGENLTLLAPNDQVRDHVHQNFLSKIEKVVTQLNKNIKKISVKTGSKNYLTDSQSTKTVDLSTDRSRVGVGRKMQEKWASNINRKFTFDNFVVGKSNQLARAAAVQVAQNLGLAYNPLFIYGGVGLGKTHLTQAVGNLIQKNHPSYRILYISSEQFIADMIRSLQHNKMNEFKRHYRSLNVLLIDDIQFFSGKDRTQEEFFHTFNVLLDSQQQMVFTSDRYPKEIDGVTERLKSRLGWGLTVSIEPPEFEMRVAILEEKANELKVVLPGEVAFFIAKHVQSNVRELEGALKRVAANSSFTGQPITLELAKESLRDLLTLQAKMVTIENIQRTVAEYYKIRVSDLLAKRRNRSFARPRQMAMALSKELTSKSLPEIGNMFGGRDHTTVLYAARKIQALVKVDLSIKEDYKNLLRILSA